MVEKITVLLADDHTVLREATAELIDHQPDMVVVAQAGTGEETLAAVRETCPDVVVMDIAMPRINGLAATKMIVAQYPQTRVLVLSAHDDPEHIVSLLEAGATGFLPKTASLNELLEAIRITRRGESALPPAVASIVVDHLAGRRREDEGSALTSRELDVLRLVTDGMTNEQIAHTLHLSPRTIEAHLTHIYTKLDVSSRTEAAIFAERKGWIRAG
jgi:two-component system, NarL family, response regulator LiaR